MFGSSGVPWGVPISPDERRRFDRQVADLGLTETDEPATPEIHELRVAAANAHRARRGVPPLTPVDDLDSPELEFYRHARALGLRRVRR